MQPLLLDLRHYETIVAIVDLGTMTAAASHLATTQSALSHRLAEAERRLGTPLFQRGHNRRLTPTRDGLAVHQAATRALLELGRLEQRIHGAETSERAMLRMAVGSYDCYHWFPNFLDHVHRTFDDIDLELVVVDDTPGPPLRAGEVDLALVLGQPEGDLELHPLFDDELVLITAPGHRLAKRDRVDAEDLVDETYLTYSSRPTPGFEYDRFIRPSGTYPRVARVVPQTSAISELVAAGAGVSILSSWALTPMLDSGRIRSVRCGNGGLDVPWHAATRPGDERAARIAQALAGELQRTSTPRPR
ncbi:MAG: LysR family transcriptional regulator [Actinomycetota bacterium]